MAEIFEKDEKIIERSIKVVKKEIIKEGSSANSDGENSSDTADDSTKE